MNLRTLFVGIVLLLQLSPIFAVPSTKEEQKADKAIQSIYAHDHQKHRSMAQRLNEMSQLFLKKPYYLGALGEGLKGEYDQFPLYRVDAFDCLTFVETVLALALANDLASFKSNMNAIRYQNGRITFVDRNHFTDLDWNSNNQRLGILQDITNTIQNEQHQPVAKTAQALINKPSWYQHFTNSRIRLVEPSLAEQNKRLLALKKSGQKLRSQFAIIQYIPLSVLFDRTGKPNQFLFNQIPDGAIIEIVRPNWDLTALIGTHLNVSHLGFGFWRHHVLMFRNASSQKGIVTEEPLTEYLGQARHSPTIKGINIQKIKSHKKPKTHVS